MSIKQTSLSSSKTTTKIIITIIISMIMSTKREDRWVSCFSHVLAEETSWIEPLVLCFPAMLSRDTDESCIKSARDTQGSSSGKAMRTKWSLLLYSCFVKCTHELMIRWIIRDSDHEFLLRKRFVFLSCVGCLYETFSSSTSVSHFFP